MPFSREEDAFLRLIRAHPQDDGPRLVYADWLDQQGDTGRGEFIRVQCALTALPLDHPRRGELGRRERELFNAHAEVWGRPWQGVVGGWEFHRGLVEGVVLPAADFLRRGGELFRRGPVRRVRLTRVAPVLTRLVESPLLARVAELALCGEDLGDGGANVLARSPHLGRLAWLDLSFNDLSDAGVERLAVAHLPGLRTLVLAENRVGDGGVSALARAAALGRLTDLDLDGNGLGDAGLKALADSQNLASLARVGWRGATFGTAGVRALARSPLLGRLLARDPVLDLCDRGLTAAAAAALASAEAMRAAVALHLDHNDLGDEGAAALARSKHFHSLTELTLARNGLGDGAAAALADAPFLERLEHLDLSQNHLTRGGQGRVRYSPRLGWRAYVNLHGQSARRRAGAVEDDLIIPLAD